MIRHILFWKLQEEYREGEKRREAEARLAASVETLAPIPGLHNAKIGPNLAGGEYDLVFYADLDDRNALAAFRDHPLHDAHRERCASLVTGRLAGDLEHHTLVCHGGGGCIGCGHRGCPLSSF